MRSILRDAGVMKAIEEENFSEGDENDDTEAKAQALIISSVSDSYLQYLEDKSAEGFGVRPNR